MKVCLNLKSYLFVFSNFQSESIEFVGVILRPDLEFALCLDHLIEQFDVKYAIIKVLAHSGHQNAVRLVRAFTSLQFHQFDHILAKFGTH